MRVPLLSATEKQRARTGYCRQRWSAKDRNIEFKFEYGSWLDLWLLSGHLHQRGKRRGQFVMARIGDRGPYSPTNVRIITTTANRLESKLTKLTPESVLEIRRLRANGWKEESLASRFGVCRSTVATVLQGRSWSHVHH